MLENQWFLITRSDGASPVSRTDLPQEHVCRSFVTSAGEFTAYFGPKVVVEEGKDFLALAVGDTRSLRNLVSYSQAGPDRHAAICILDKTSGSLRVITDRVSFCKIFCYQHSNDLSLATHLALFDRRQMPLSMRGIASAIANGTQFDNLTIYRDVSVLQSASVHDFAGGKCKSAKYWHYEFAGSLARDVAKKKLKDGLVDAVRDQICDHPVLLSLSGGYDSSGILGLLGKIGMPQSISTFSYVFGEPMPGSDALVAQQQARLLGVPHEIVQAYHGNAQETIWRNARLGQGISNFCNELDAWHQHGQRFKGSIVLAGDECFGWADRRLVSRQDVLLTVCLRQFESVAPLFPYLDSSIKQELSSELATKTEEMLSRTEESSLHTLKDVLYLEQRIAWSLLPWRRFLIGEYFEVREPFLHTPLLDVIKCLSEKERIGKSLYREAIQELAPEVFRIPRARTGQAAPDWRQEALRDSAAIEQLLDFPSRLDTILSPAAIQSFVSSLRETAAPRESWKMTVRRLVGPAATQVLRSFVRPEAPRYQPSDALLIRILALRCFLAQ